MAAVAVASVLLVSWFSAMAQDSAKQEANKVRSELAEYRKYNDAQLADVKDASRRTEVKIDALLLNMGIRNPAPAPKDAGN
jgi:cell division protein FtsL